MMKASRNGNSSPMGAIMPTTYNKEYRMALMLLICLYVGDQAKCNQQEDLLGSVEFRYESEPGKVEKERLFNSVKDLEEYIISEEFQKILTCTGQNPVKDRCIGGKCFSVKRPGLQNVNLTVAREMCKGSNERLANINETVAKTLREEACRNGASTSEQYFTALTYNNHNDTIYNSLNIIVQLPNVTKQPSEENYLAIIWIPSCNDNPPYGQFRAVEYKGPFHGAICEEDQS